MSKIISYGNIYFRDVFCQYVSSIIKKKKENSQDLTNYVLSVILKSSFFAAAIRRIFRTHVKNEWTVTGRQLM
jgi:predicted transposase YbfD/YdcC